MPDVYDSYAIEPAADRRYAQLCDLRDRIIPEQRFDEFAKLLQDKSFDVLTPFDGQPLLSPLSQFCRAENPDRWLKIVAAAEPEKFSSAICPQILLYRGGRTTDESRSDYRATAVNGTLASFLFYSGRDIGEIAALDNKLLAQTVSDEYNRENTMLFQAIFNIDNPATVLDKITAVTGNADFLYTRNARGETLLHFIAQQPGFAEDLKRLDAVSWMLQEKPLLVNEPDRYGWTPLDRLVSLSPERVDTSMARLLIASGGTLDRQIAPKFNLAAELSRRDAQRLDKPRTPKGTLKPGAN